MNVARKPHSLSHLLNDIRPEALRAPESGIIEVVNYGRGREGVIPLWVGEGDTPTPAFIVDGAIRALAAGETFYTWQRGIPELREALARYHMMHFDQPFKTDRFFVTQSGMQAVQICLRLVAGIDDEVIVPTPSWPNFAATVGIFGAKPVMTPMIFSEKGWQLDYQLIEDSISPRTKAIFVNSPSNPTGWVASHADIAFLLDLSRRHGIWIVADETYGRFYYAGGRAPSFHDVGGPDDKVLFVNTFSKNWAMTGWRLGWIEASPKLGQTIENLIQYSTSGVASFLQRAGVSALDLGEEFVKLQVDRALQGRDIVTSALAATGRIQFAPVAGAFYLFFSVQGKVDDNRLAIEIVDRANVGLAPGTAFGAGGEGFMRLCFLRSPEQLRVATQRLVDWLEQST